MILPTVLTNFLFYTAALILIGAAMGVVSAKNPVRAVLCLILSFFVASFLWILLQAEFLALTLIIVYVGAVMVLFLFVVMMLDINIATLKEGFNRYYPLGLLIAGVVIAELVLVFAPKASFTADYQHLPLQAADYSDIKTLGIALFSNYLLAFELAGVLLLVAIVAAIGLVFRRPRNRMVQNIAEQVKVRRSDRIKLVDLPKGNKS